jgi:hypothetical protein
MLKNNIFNNLNAKIPTELKNQQHASILNNYSTFQNASRFDEIKLITIGLASPDKVRVWAETKLPDGTVLGQVYNANTLHHKTLKPLKGGLFCERIFGPTKDFQCSCGIQKDKPVSRVVHRNNRQFCSKCNVEYTWALKRRYQLGYIRLVSPVTHLWYLKSSPSFIAVMLDMKRKDVEAITYCAETLTIDSAWKPGRNDIHLWPSLKTLQHSLFTSANRELQNSLLESTVKNFYIKHSCFIDTNSINVTQLNFLITNTQLIDSYLNHFKNSKISYEFWWRFFKTKTNVSSSILSNKSGKYLSFVPFYLMTNQPGKNQNFNQKRQKSEFRKTNSNKLYIVKKLNYNLKNIKNFNKKFSNNLVYTNPTTSDLCTNVDFKVYSYYGINKNTSLVFFRSLDSDSIKIKKKYSFSQNWIYFLKDVPVKNHQKNYVINSVLENKVREYKSVFNQYKFQNILIENINTGLSNIYLDQTSKVKLCQFKLLKNNQYFMKLNLTNKKFILLYSWKIFWDFAYKISKFESINNFKTFNDVIYKLHLNKLFLKKNIKCIIQDKKNFNSIRLFDFTTLKKQKLSKKKTHLKNNLKSNNNKINYLFLGNKFSDCKNLSYKLNLKSLKLNFCFYRVSFKLFLLVSQYFFKKLLDSFNNISFIERENYTKNNTELLFQNLSKKNITNINIKVLIQQKKKLLLALIKKIRIESICWKIVQQIIKLETLVTKNYLNLILKNKLSFIKLIKNLPKSLVKSLKNKQKVFISFSEKLNHLDSITSKGFNKISVQVLNSKASNTLINSILVDWNQKQFNQSNLKSLQLLSESAFFKNSSISVGNTLIPYSEISKQVSSTSTKTSIHALANFYNQLTYWYKEQSFVSKHSNSLKLRLSLKTEKTILILKFFLKFSIENFLENKSSISKILKNATFLNKNFLKNFLFKREILFDRVLKLIQKYYFFKKLGCFMESKENFFETTTPLVYSMQSTKSIDFQKIETCLDLFFEEILKILKLNQIKLKQIFNQSTDLGKIIELPVKQLHVEQFSVISHSVKSIDELNLKRTLSLSNKSKNKQTEKKFLKLTSLNLTIPEILLILKNKYRGSNKFIEVLKQEKFSTHKKFIPNKKMQKNFAQKRNSLYSKVLLSVRNLVSKSQYSSNIPLSVLIIKFFNSIIFRKNPFETVEQFYNECKSNTSWSIFTKILMIDLNKIILRILLITNFVSKNHIKKVKKQGNNFKITQQKIDFNEKFNLNFMNSNLKQKEIFIESIKSYSDLGLVTKKCLWALDLVLNSETTTFTLFEANSFKKCLINFTSVFNLFSVEGSSFFKKSFFNRFSMSNWKHWIKIIKISSLQSSFCNILVKLNNFNNFFQKKLLVLNTNLNYIKNIKNNSPNSNYKILSNQNQCFSKMLNFCKLQKKLQIDVWKFFKLKELLTFDKISKTILYQASTSSFLNQSFVTKTFFKPVNNYLNICLKKFFIVSRNYLLKYNFCSESDSFNFKISKIHFYNLNFFIKEISVIICQSTSLDVGFI